MNQAIIASVPMAPMQMPVVRRRIVKVTEPEIKLPQEAHEVRYIYRSCSIPFWR